MHEPIIDFGVERLLVTSRSDLYVGSLRYFDTAGPFVANVESLLRTKLPNTLKSSVTDATDQSGAVLAWRSPTETLLITSSAAGFDAITRFCSITSGGCFVDQSSGYGVICASGRYVSALIDRLGDSTLMPASGESKRGRLGDLPILVLKVKESETLLIADRAYQTHLVQWIRETAMDLPLDLKEAT